MDSKLYALLVAVLAALCVSCATALSIPKEVKQNSIDEENDVDPNERATWLETREESNQENFKNLVLYTLWELEQEGYVADGVVQKGGNSMEKRGRWQGFCFRRTRSGRFLPYICWKGEARK